LESWIEWLRGLLDVRAIIQWGGIAGVTTIVFVETGMFVGFFLPGDSLLVTAGLIAAGGGLDIWILNALLIPAAIVGDSVGYSIGFKAGPALFTREKSIFFAKDHLVRTRLFYEKYGGKTIVLARFIPIIRTFAPVVAGVGTMPYARFLFFNVFGGIGWVLSMTLIGYFLGQAIPNIEQKIHIVVAVVVALSVLPIVNELWKARARKRGTARIL